MVVYKILLDILELIDGKEKNKKVLGLFNGFFREIMLEEATIFLFLLGGFY